MYAHICAKRHWKTFKLLSHRKHLTPVTNFILLCKILKNTNWSVLQYQWKPSATANSISSRTSLNHHYWCCHYWRCRLTLFSLPLGTWHFRGIWIWSYADFKRHLFRPTDTRSRQQVINRRREINCRPCAKTQGYVSSLPFLPLTLNVEEPTTRVICMKGQDGYYYPVHCFDIQAVYITPTSNILTHIHVTWCLFAFVHSARCIYACTFI